jgi:hypothetical protein
MWKTLELYGNYYRRLWNIVEDRPELDGRVRKLVEATRTYKTWARLAPTLTHVATHDLMTSGAKDEAMSVHRPSILVY